MKQLKNFAGMKGALAEREPSRIVVVPVPYDKTSTWIKGADNGPFAILEASIALELYDIETDYEVYTKGIHTAGLLPVKSDPPDEMICSVENEVAELISKKKFPVILGGEHSVTIGSVSAHAAVTEDLCVLQLDAHADLRDEYEGSRFNHACVTSRLKEKCSVVQVGIRSMDISEKEKVDPENIFFARDIVRNNNWAESVVDRLSANVYVTIDLDVFDPGIMPSTGTPEPGGLSWYDVTGLLRRVSETKNIVGFDCVELCPDSHNKAPDFLAAKLVYKLLGYVFKNKMRCEVRGDINPSEIGDG